MDFFRASIPSFRKISFFETRNIMAWPGLGVVAGSVCGLLSHTQLFIIVLWSNSSHLLCGVSKHCCYPMTVQVALFTCKLLLFNTQMLGDSFGRLTVTSIRMCTAISRTWSVRKNPESMNLITAFMLMLGSATFSEAVEEIMPAYFTEQLTICFVIWCLQVTMLQLTVHEEWCVSTISNVDSCVMF